MKTSLNLVSHALQSSFVEFASTEIAASIALKGRPHNHFQPYVHTLTETACFFDSSLSATTRRVDSVPPSVCYHSIIIYHH